jgi:hypothetical protein
VLPAFLLLRVQYIEKFWGAKDVVMFFSKNDCIAILSKSKVKKSSNAPIVLLARIKCYQAL